MVGFYNFDNLNPIEKQIIKSTIETMPCISKLNPGYITNIEPSIKPIIPKYVYDLTNLNKKFIRHKNSVPPIKSPIPIGSKNDKFKLEIAER